MKTNLLRQLRAMVAAMPPGSSVSLPTDWLREELDNTEAESEPTPEATRARAAEPDKMLGVKQAAERLGVNPRWIYRRADQLPFTRRLTSGTLRFSEAGIERYLKARA